MTISDKANTSPFLLKNHNNKQTKNKTKKSNNKKGGGGHTAKTNLLSYGKLLKYSSVRIQSEILIPWSTLNKIRNLNQIFFLPEEQYIDVVSPKRKWNMTAIVTHWFFTTFFITHTKPSNAFLYLQLSMEEWRQSLACNTYTAKLIQTNTAHYLWVAMLNKCS